MLRPEIYHEVVQLVNALDLVQLLKTHFLVQNFSHQRNRVFHFIVPLLYQETAPEKLNQSVSVVRQADTMNHLFQRFLVLLFDSPVKNGLLLYSASEQAS